MKHLYYALLAFMCVSGGSSVWAQDGTRQPGDYVDDNDASFAQTNTVYFEQQQNWHTTYCYMWIDGTSPVVQNAPYPGVAMTAVESDVYSCTYSEAYNRVIFSDGSNRKTADNILVEGNLYRWHDNGHQAIDLGKYSPSFPDVLYMVGNFTAPPNWLNTPKAMTRTGDGTYELNYVVLNDPTATKGFFQFITTPGSTNWTQVGTVYAAGNMNKPIANGESLPLYVDTKAHNSFECVKGVYNVYVDLAQRTVRVQLITTSAPSMLSDGSDNVVARYGIDGRQMSPQVRGWVIEHHADGHVTKTLRP